MRTVMEETVMEGPSDAGSIPASSISCGKEGPTQWEDALSHTTDSWLKFENVYVRMDRKMRY